MPDGTIAPCRSRQRHQHGVSYIELAISIAVLSVLAGIALPAYRSIWLRTNRSEAVAALMRLQLSQEKYFLQNGRYARSLPELEAAAGSDTGARHYVLGLAAGTEDHFLAEALASGPQAADRADCQRLSIDERGERSPPASSGCWR